MHFSRYDITAFESRVLLPAGICDLALYRSAPNPRFTWVKSGCFPHHNLIRD